MLTAALARSRTAQAALAARRRAERAAVALCREEAIGAQVIPYLNRLSDLLFMLARRQNHAAGKPETYWRKDAASDSSSPQEDQ